MKVRPEVAFLNKSAADQLLVVHFTGCKVRLDEGKLDCLHDELLALAEEQRASDLHLDFDNVEYLTSAALDALVRLHKELLVREQYLSVINLRARIHETFVVAGLHKFLHLRLRDPEPEAAAAEDPSRFPAGILLADDETAVLCDLAARLRGKGYPVWLAEHGTRAVELYRRYREKIGLVLLDELMPGLDGPHTLIALQQICPTVRCCFMTGNLRGYTDKTLLLLGALRVFRKPLAFIEVMRLLNHLTGPAPRRRQDRWIEIP